MLKLTRKLEYALIALSHINKKRDVYSSAKEISRQYMIPQELLAKTLQQMKQLNYIVALKGSKGGYILNNCNIKLPINKINNNLRSILNNINLSEIAN